MIDKIYLIFCIAVLGDMLAVRFEPIQSVKHKLIKSTSYISSVLNKTFDKLLNCSRCVSFWVCLLYTHNILDACLAGLFGFLINHLHDRVSYWYDRD